jgi:hypothetical protein
VLELENKLNKVVANE